MKRHLGCLALVLLAGCSSINQPAFTFKLNKADCEKDCTLTRHPTSAIQAAPGTVVRLTMDDAYLTKLPDKWSDGEGYSGKKEVMLYATIYKNGNFLKFSKITDIADNMASYQPVVVQNGTFFTETVDGSYHIVIKGFEVDTKNLVRLLRRVRTTDVSEIASGSTPFAPGATFVAGFQDVIYGFFDIVLSITGRSFDDWTGMVAAEKVFEHSLYVVPGNPKTQAIAKEPETLVILDSGDLKYFQTSAGTNDLGVAAYTKSRMDEIEKHKPFSRKDFENGTDMILNGSSHVSITVERLGASD